MARTYAKARRAWWCSVSLLSMACLIAAPLRGQELEDPILAPGRMIEVPYAVLAETLLSALTERHDAGGLAEWARNHGLDPDSAAVQELLDLALQLEREHPRGLTPEDREELLQRFTGDAEGLRIWSEERRIRRYGAAGEAFGHWLEARRAEGYPPEFLIERLLSRRAALVARASAAAVQPPVSLPDFQIETLAFEEGMRNVMDTVPERFQSNTETAR